MSTTAVANPPQQVEQIFNTKPRGLWSHAMHRLFHRRSAIIGMLMLGGLLFIAIFAPVLATHDPVQSLIGIEDVKKREAPCLHALGCPAERTEHFFGTDGNVRDLYSRVIYGARHVAGRRHSLGGLCHRHRGSDRRAVRLCRRLD